MIYVNLSHVYREVQRSFFGFDISDLRTFLGLENCSGGGVTLFKHSSNILG